MAVPSAISDDAVRRLHELIAMDIQAMNDLIIQRVFSEVGIIPDLAQHLIKSGGKRLRPLLTLTAARLCGYDGTDHIKLATAVELMHTATLLHDDVVDGQEQRRGKKTARMIWGNQASVLVGDFLLGRAFLLMVEVGNIRALQILSQAAATIAEGEVLQLVYAASDPSVILEANYLKVIEAKTAALFAAAAELGGVVAGRAAEECAALATYGHRLGVAFQIVDDALDYMGDSHALGKDIGTDFREGKVTLPVIIAHSHGNDEERAFWLRCMRDKQQGDGDLEHAVQLMTKHDALSASVIRATQYGDEATGALAILPQNTYTSALADLVTMSIERDH